MEKVYENIRAIRKAKNISQADMADKLGMYPANYNRLESGKTEITLARLQQIAEIFGMSVIELLQYGDGNAAESVKEDSEKVKLLEQDLIGSYTYLHECVTFLRYFKETMLEHYKSVPNEDANLITLADLNKTWTKKVSFKFNDVDYQKHLLETPLKMAKIGDLFDACLVLHDSLNRYKRDLEKRHEHIDKPAIDNEK
jgi:transcriptional regulator with XRE-family HTH domain